MVTGSGDFGSVAPLSGLVSSEFPLLGTGDGGGGGGRVFFKLSVPFPG